MPKTNRKPEARAGSLERMVRLPVSRFTHGNSARRNMMADPLTPTADKWLLDAGWEVVGYCENPPLRELNPHGRFFVGLMLQAPDGRDYWWHWTLARGPKALEDWRHSEWPVARQHNEKGQR